MFAKDRMPISAEDPSRCTNKDARKENVRVAAPATKFSIGCTDGSVHSCDAMAYSVAKIMGERVCKNAAATSKKTKAICLRIGWCQPGENLPATMTATGTPTVQASLKPQPGYDDPNKVLQWFREMWLSNGDLCRLVDRCVFANIDDRMTIVNAMSRNTGSRWILDNAIGYEPVDDVAAHV